MKWGVRADLTLDVTVNTDFAQVEADEEQVNLTRFDLFFPEKRPFFLENASDCSSSASRSRSTCSSRGASACRRAAQPIDILGGGRLSGKLAAARTSAC